MRRVNDFYPTEQAITQVLLQQVGIDGMIAEPCAGDGRMATILREHGLVVTNDIDSTFETTQVGDARCRESAVWQEEYDWVVTNPPFSVAFPILQVAMERARVGVAFLLRLTFLEPTQERGEWLKAHADCMTHLIPLGQPRPSFTGDGGRDSVTTAWMVWQRGWSWRRLGAEPPFQFVYNWRQRPTTSHVSFVFDDRSLANMDTMLDGRSTRDVSITNPYTGETQVIQIPQLESKECP